MLRAYGGEFTPHILDIQERFPELSLELHALDYAVEDILDTIDTVQAFTYIAGPVHVNKNNLCSSKLHPEQPLS